MNLVGISYSPPFEEEKNINISIWNKGTIQYVIENKAKILKRIRSGLRFLPNIHIMDIDDLFDDLVECLIIAPEYSNDIIINGWQVTLDAYINSYITICIKRFKCKQYKLEKGRLRNIIYDEEGNKKDLIESIEDKTALLEYENTNMGLESHLKTIKNIRYKYGQDIFLILYVYFQTINKDEQIKESIFSLLGLSKKELKEMRYKIEKDTDVMELMKLLSECTCKAAIAALEKYVYGVHTLKAAIENM